MFPALRRPWWRGWVVSGVFSYSTVTSHHQLYFVSSCLQSRATQLIAGNKNLIFNGCNIWYILDPLLCEMSSNDTKSRSVIMSRETRRFIFLKNTCTSSRQIQEDYSFHRKGDRPGLGSAVWHHSLVQACIVRSLVSTFSRVTRQWLVRSGAHISPRLLVWLINLSSAIYSGQLHPALAS